MTTNRTALILTNDTELAEKVMPKLRAARWEPVLLTSLEDASAFVVRNPASGLVLIDLRFDRDLHLADLVSARDPLTVMVILTEFETIDTAVRAIRQGVSDFITRDVTDSEFEDLLRRVQALTELRSGGSFGRVERMFSIIVERLDAVDTQLRSLRERYVGAT